MGAGMRFRGWSPESEERTRGCVFKFNLVSGRVRTWRFAGIIIGPG